MDGDQRRTRLLFSQGLGEYVGRDRELASQTLAFRTTLRTYITQCVTHRRGQASQPLSDAIWMLFEGAMTTALIIGPDAARQAAQVARQLLQSGAAR